MNVEPRPITSAESEVLRTILKAASVRTDTEMLFKVIESLYVNGACNCGCASVDFETSGDIGEVRILADGIGTTAEGGMVGLLVWGSATSITGLEVYDLGAGYDEKQPERFFNERVRLPVPESIRKWEDAGGT